MLPLERWNIDACFWQVGICLMILSTPAQSVLLAACFVIASSTQTASKFKLVRGATWLTDLTPDVFSLKAQVVIILELSCHAASSLCRVFDERFVLQRTSCCMIENMLHTQSRLDCHTESNQQQAGRAVQNR